MRFNSRKYMQAASCILLHREAECRHPQPRPAARVRARPSGRGRGRPRARTSCTGCTCALGYGVTHGTVPRACWYRRTAGATLHRPWNPYSTGTAPLGCPRPLGWHDERRGRSIAGASACCWHVLRGVKTRRRTTVIKRELGSLLNA